MSQRSKRDTSGGIIGPAVALILSLFTKNTRKVTANDLEKSEFKSSTQRVGLRFTGRIRNVFRSRWIKKR